VYLNTQAAIKVLQTRLARTSGSDSFTRRASLLVSSTPIRELTGVLIAECDDLLARHDAYVRANLEDMPEVQEWVWTD
jgi:hypothetical protein